MRPLACLPKLDEQFAENLTRRPSRERQAARKAAGRGRSSSESRPAGYQLVTSPTRASSSFFGLRNGRNAARSQPAGAGIAAGQLLGFRASALPGGSRAEAAAGPAQSRGVQ